MELQGTALITGASSGIGAAYADRLATRGFDLVLVARDKERLKTLARRITDETNRCLSLVIADLTQKTDLLRVEQMLRTQKITMLVNNAGTAISGDFIEHDPDRLEQMIALNVLAP